MKQTVSKKETLAIGLMTFSLFLGAGNIIFPPTLGYDAGAKLWTAVFGFLITGVGLPLLGVVAVAKAGGDLQHMAKRVHPYFSIVFSVLVYLAIGPLLGIPRTGAVAFEIGVAPFLSDTMRSSFTSLFVYTLLFYGVVFWLCLNPSKLTDRFGKIITPLMLVLLAILLLRGAISPLGSFTPGTIPSPFSKGFVEGYNTMDTIAALVFGIVISIAVYEKGVTDKKLQAGIIIKAGCIAAIGLGLLYVGLAYLGATSGHMVGTFKNGGQLITALAQNLMGNTGLILLSLAITFACLTTAVGLITSSAEFFAKISGNRLSYRLIMSILTVFSLIISNFGLTKILAISVPLLVTLYPIAIVLILLILLNDVFGGRRPIYIGGIAGAALLSILDGCKAAGMDVSILMDALSQVAPMKYLIQQGFGWILPALIGIILGALFTAFSHTHSHKTVTS